MCKTLKIGNKTIGNGQPSFIIAEIGINHNGKVSIAKDLIDLAALSGCDAVKFQKRDVETCVPEAQKSVMRETPWGYMTYQEYRRRIEFETEEYREIDNYCKDKNMLWFASCWEKASVDFLEQFDVPCYKIPSACLTDSSLLRHIKSKNKPILLSTGMSTMEQIRAAIEILGTDQLGLMHSTSSYPCKNNELNLKVINALKEEFDCAIGYSGHEVGLIPTVSAVCMGATVIERHITLDRAMWGTDQAASVESQGLMRLVKYIRVAEEAMGNGIKCVYRSEQNAMEKLRRVCDF